MNRSLRSIACVIISTVGLHLHAQDWRTELKASFHYLDPNSPPSINVDFPTYQGQKSIVEEQKPTQPVLMPTSAGLPAEKDKDKLFRLEEKEFIVPQDREDVIKPIVLRVRGLVSYFGLSAMQNGVGASLGPDWKMSFRGIKRVTLSRPLPQPGYYIH